MPIHTPHSQTAGHTGRMSGIHAHDTPISNLPSPSDILGRVGWPTWYPSQDRAFSAILDWIDSPSRFMCANLPTGSGKSLLCALAANVAGRTAILTATKGLQTQYLKDFGYMNDIRGMNAYRCELDNGIQCDDGICHLGVQCDFKLGGCNYYDAVRKALKGDAVITNYAYWLAQAGYATGLGRFSLLVCDEAHLMPHALQSYVECDIGTEEILSLGIPRPPTQWKGTPDWASSAKIRVELEIERIRIGIPEEAKAEDVPRGMARTLRRLRSLSGRLARLVSAVNWVSSSDRGIFHFSPVWSEPYAPSVFLDVPKVLLMSAWVPRHSVDRMNTDSQPKWMTMPSMFPPKRTPIFHVPTIRVGYQTTEEEYRLWVHRIDQIVDRRLDRKGVLFTVSYRRRNTFMEHTRHRNIVVSHQTKDISSAIAGFKAVSPPALLVSPSATSGWDFPGDACEYIIIGKIPYPDTSTPIAKKRTEEDKQWSSYEALGTLIQSAGRGTRSAEDACEVIIIDDNWIWFWKRYGGEAPDWFKQRVVGTLRTIPNPPDKWVGGTFV